MANIILKKSWELPERAAMPESAYLNRRRFLADMGSATGITAGLSVGISAGLTAGISAAGSAGLLALSPREAAARSLKDTLTGLKPLSAGRNPDFQVADPLTPLSIAGKYNNFYEFSRGKEDVWAKAEKLTTEPWSVEVTGLVKKPRRFDVSELIRRMPIEERVYHFRCVEAWSMVVPWVGFPMSALLKEVGPLSGAKYVQMTTFLRPEEATRQGQRSWFGAGEPWPYTEGLTLAEAMNDLTLLAVGIYGNILPKQFGAPIRLIVPWKYGFKSIKSIVRIELTAQRPPTFWNILGPSEYGFVSNVNPKVPHPRWSQAFERDIGTRNRKPTLLYNGYAEQVAGLYKG